MTGKQNGGAEADAPYWDGLGAGRLMLQKCGSCGQWQWPAVFRCGDCGTWNPPWREISPKGTLFSWTRTWQVFPGLEPLGLPFVSVLVALDEADGHRLMGTLVGEDTGIAIGKPVTGEIVQRSLGGVTMPTVVWRL